MLVKYVGKQDSIVAEYNGKKYSLNRKTPVKEIPDEVFSFIKSSNSVLSSLVVPYQPGMEASENSRSEEIEQLKAKIAEIEADNERLKKKIEKLLAKIDKNK